MRLEPIAVVTCAVILALSVPAQAGPKDDCERGIQEANAVLTERVLDHKLRDNMHRVFVRAEEAQKEKKFKQCLALTKNIKEQVKTK